MLREGNIWFKFKSQKDTVLDGSLNQSRTVGNGEKFYAHYCILKNILLSSTIQVR